jgi:pimeloyl-ACP methyl ester carboxylesterase
VKCPTLIIWGCLDGALDRELAALSAESVDGPVSVKYIEDSSHWTPMDRYQLVNTYMKQFLDASK